MKLVVRFKGGPGSGHRGHSGRPGKRGGSSPGTGGAKAVPSSDAILSEGMDIMNKIYADRQMRKIATGLMADGSIDDVSNLSYVVEEELNEKYGTDTDFFMMYSDLVSDSDDEDEDSVGYKFWMAYDQATDQVGYYVSGEEITDQRKAWERYYYGRDVGGPGEGEAFAIESLKAFIRTGETPHNEYPKARKPRE